MPGRPMPSNYLTAAELAELVQCQPNQRRIMARWLTAHHWVWAEGRDGLPRVARAYHDKKMGLTDGKKQKLEATPNLDAFRDMGANRDRPAVQARRGT
ncbi:MAG: DUF4224 domain-containing protein [Alcaligenaceae bacterium]|nr:DUF4224 domain-containing protein [Alcaligenaceae bacterium SAGV5]MPS51224.1 DUF4224 domain-containing protein [Alcaligenaceae bacterium SAGV3]MPT57279.1 DUF4224 domain-containing protein [Alcaligenaceae bacterium]